MDLMAIRRRLLMMAAAVRRVLHTITSAAGIVSFSTNLAEPVESLVCEVAPVQEGSGNPSPDNIRPITGWDKLNIHRFSLPPGYTPVDYVTITQPFTVSQITGLDTFNRNDLVVDCTWMSKKFSGNYKAIYTTTYSAESYNITRLIYSTNASAYIVCNKSKAGGGSTTLTGLAGSTWHTIESRYGGGTIDGSTYTSSTTQGTANAATAINFGHADCNISFRNFSIRSSAEGGAVYIQLIPCTDPNNVAGFYDLIGRHFWTTAASTSATATGTPGKIAWDGEDIIEVDWAATYRRLKDITFDGAVHYESTVHLIGSDVVTMTITPGLTTGMNVFGCYSGTGSSARNFSFFNYQNTSQNAYFRYGTVLLRPNWGTTATRTVSFGAGGTDGFRTDVTTPETEFVSTDAAWIGMLPNSNSAHFTGTITGSIKVGSRMEFIPVERVSDGKIGYYDTLNSTFLAPVGSGTPTTSGYDETDPGTVYGGTLDVATGVLTVTHSFWTADKNQEWLYSSGWSKTNTACFYVNGQTDVYYPNDTYLSYTHCDEFKCYTRNQLYSSDSEGIAPSGGASNTAFTLRIAKSRASTVEELKPWLESNPIHVVFVRKTPLTYQLTPAEVSAIIGSNTIWHDAFGGITVSYYDTK